MTEKLLILKNNLLKQLASTEEVGHTLFSSIQLAGGTGDQGKISWNSDEETLDLVQNNATLQLGQEVQIHCRNNTGSTISNGTVVMATGTLGASGRITIAPMNASAEANAKYLLGVATYDIANGADGKITVFGKVRNINTAAWAEGTVLYCNQSVNGGLTSTKPSSSLALPIAFVVYSHATVGTLMIRVTNISENISGSSSGVSATGLFYKPYPTQAAFYKTAGGGVSAWAGLKVNVAGTEVTLASDTAVTLPSMSAGTDYGIWIKDDGTLQAKDSYQVAPGTGNWRLIGGFHYAPGGNATAQAGGDATPTINQYSLWDLRFRPACKDPRGMTLVADSFWADIYLTCTEHLVLGNSRYNATIADSSSPPKIPYEFGGNGSNSYSSFNYWDATEVLQSHGKRLPAYAEFSALAYGTTEATSSGGTDVPTTGVNSTEYTNTWNKFTSKWGAIQASGCQWHLSCDFGGGTATGGWVVNTGGRGSTQLLEGLGLFGGTYDTSTNSGSRCSYWNLSPSVSAATVSCRGVCDHLIIWD